MHTDSFSLVYGQTLLRKLLVIRASLASCHLQLNQVEIIFLVNLLDEEDQILLYLIIDNISKKSTVAAVENRFLTSLFCLLRTNALGKGKNIFDQVWIK